MKLYSFPHSLILLVISASGLRSAELWPASDRYEITPEFVDRLVTEAKERNPALQAANARVQSANSAVDAVRTWEDPSASFGVWSSGSGGFPASQQGNLIYGIDQKLPLYGRPDLERRVAAAGASREQFLSDFESQKLRRDLRIALDGLALADQEAQIAKQDVAWLDTTLAAVDHRYRVALASQVDWLRIQRARAMAVDELTTRQREREHGAVALNRLLNRDLHAPWPEATMPALQSAIYYTPQLVGAALAAEPQLKVLRQDSVAAQASADLTRRERLPEVSVGIQAWQYSGTGGLRQGIATVSFSVPWANRSSHDSEWRRDQERKRASDLAAEDYALSVREELHHRIVDFDAARRQALLYSDQLIPLTEQTLASAQAAWEHDRGTFLDILDAHRLLLSDRLALAQALTDQADTLTEICLLTGSRDPGALATLAGDPSFEHDGPISNDSK